MLHLSDLLSTCVIYGVVPDTFSEGILVPILKKPNIGPSGASNYRPLAIWVIFSKLLELYMLDWCDFDIFADPQYGFITERGTNMAKSGL